MNETVAAVIGRHPNWRRIGAPPASLVTGSDKIGDTQGKTFTDAFKPRQM